ncbi:hypothetical protein [Microbacterium arborescens]|jgi:hypothetical protein|uniref:hypothetical protein n=1 Tax=Microbacterium TaxID=33882 RepID=UPI0025A1D5D3|nr:hypothetical protein [Microbacterium arborescens]WJM15672.1 hypothetical protein QUC20_15590 [Microbacterium arborescens]
MSSIDRPPLSGAAWVLVGAGGAVVGLLPWLITGARLPLQNLAADQTDLTTPFSLLPFSQYYLTTIVSLLVVGGAVAGLAARILRHRRSRRATGWLTLGVAVIQVIAIAQSSVVTVSMLEDSSRRVVYAAAVIAVMVVSLLMSVLVLLLTARAPVPGAAIALSLAALTVPGWIGLPLQSYLSLANDPVTSAVLLLLRWLPAVLVGAVIAWCGFRTAGRVAAVVVSLAALWIGPAFFTAVSSAAGTRVLAPYPAEMADYGIGVFAMALTAVELVVPPLIVAACIGAVGALVLTALRRRPRSESSGAVADHR